LCWVRISSGWTQKGLKSNKFRQLVYSLRKKLNTTIHLWFWWLPYSLENVSKKTWDDVEILFPCGWLYNLFNNLLEKEYKKKSVTQKPWNHQTGFKDIRRTSSLILPGHKYPHTWQSTKNLEAKAKEDGILLKRLKWQNAIYTYIFLVDWPQRHLR